jgi:heterogeneous nuclear ribonucleoprotein A1/A3
MMDTEIVPNEISDDLKDHFSPYGKIVEHQIMLDHSTGRSRGFGFVTFESEDSVERVISEGRMRDLGGKQVSFIPWFESTVVAMSFCWAG